MYFYNNPSLLCDEYPVNMNVSRCNKSHSILNTGDSSLGGNVRNNNGSSYTDTHSSNSRSMDAMYASNPGNSPSTMVSAIQYKWEGKEILSGARQQFEPVLY